MAYNIGPKIGIDGEAEFRRQIREINTAYKTMEAETKALTSAFDAQGDAQGKLKAQSSQLEKQIDVQKRKMDLLENAVSKAADQFGENSIEANRLKGALYDTQATVTGLESELADTRAELDKFAEGIENVAEEADDANGSIIHFGDILNANLAADLVQDALYEMGDLVKDFAKGSIEAAADVKAAGSQFSQTFGDMEGAASTALERISKDTDIAATRMQGDFTKLFAFSKTVGADSAMALDIASRAMVAAADNAAYYDKSIEEVTESLQSFLKGNYENDAALGIAATETTRNAKANELYALSFDKLSESQKVDVLLAMVEAGNQASGAIGQAARESDSWQNVTGELNEAVRQLQAALGAPVLELAIPVIQEITDAIQKLIQETDASKLSDGIQEFTDSLEVADKQLKDFEKNTAAAAYGAEWYVKRLEKLTAAGLETADAQNEYAAIVAELNNLIPGLNLSIDEQTGTLSQNTVDILANIEAWKERAVLQAMQDSFTAKLQAQGQAEAELYDAKAALVILEREEAVLLQRLNSATSEGSKEASKLTQEWMSNKNAQMALNQEIAKGEKTLAGYESELQDAQQAMVMYQTETGKTVAAQDEQILKTQEVEAELDALEVAYEEAVQAAKNSIDSQIGLFDTLSMESELSTLEMIEAWASQETAFLSYTDNLKKAADMGLDETLIQQFSDGSKESMIYLNELVNGTETDVEKINEAWKGLSDAKDSAANQMAIVTSAIKQEADKLATDLETSGANSGAGLIRGLESYEPKAYTAGYNLGLKVRGGYNGAMDINSPSRVMEESGEFSGEGAIKGVKNKFDEMEKTMAEFAGVGETAFLEARLAEVADYPIYAQIPSQVTKSSVVRNSVGDLTFHIYQNEGEDAEEFAHRVADILQTDILRKEAALSAE